MTTSSKSTTESLPYSISKTLSSSLFSFTSKLATPSV